MDTKLVIIKGVPHWQYPDGTLIRPIAGGQLRPGETLDAFLERTRPGGTAATATRALSLGGGGGAVSGGGGNIQIGGDGRSYDISTDAGFSAWVNSFAPRDDEGSSRGFAPPSFSSTRAGLEFQAAQERAMAAASRVHDAKLLGIQNQFTEAQAKRDNAFARGERLEGQKWQQEMQRLQQVFEAAEANKQRDFEREMRKEELKAERQRIFTDMLGKDPVRATLFALGVGGEILPGGERFEDLPPLKGAKEFAGKTELALEGLLGGEVGGKRQDVGFRGIGDITLGRTGVEGLPPAVKAARAFQQAGAGGKQLLTSGFGVGSLKGQPGIVPEEFRSIIESVTPKGQLR